MTTLMKIGGLTRRKRGGERSEVEDGTADESVENGGLAGPRVAEKDEMRGRR